MPKAMKRILTLCALALAALTASAQNYDHLYNNLPIELTQPTAPQIPSLTLNVTDFGAVGDGLTLNTEAFAKAIAALDKQGGGHLVVPAGIFLSGPISLKSNIDLHLQHGAILLATPDRTLHLKDNKPTTFISASKRSNISITGGGIIDGNGEYWRPVKRSKVSDTEWKEYLALGGTVTDDGSLWYPYDLLHYDNYASSPKAQERGRTHLIRLTDCQNILISGVTIQNAPKFHLIPTRCSNVIIDGITVRCPWNAQNGDGIDLSSCRNVLVVGCSVDVGDDGICMKAGAGESGVKYGPCDNILITQNTVFRAHGGFVIGSEFTGGMSNIVVRDNTFAGTDTGLRFKSGIGRGGVCKDIHISNIRMIDIKDEAIVFDCGYENRSAGEAPDAKGVETGLFAPHFCDIHISDVVCHGAETAIAARGLETHRCVYDVTVERSTFFYTKSSEQLSGEVDIRLTDCTFESFSHPQQE